MLEQLVLCALQGSDKERIKDNAERGSLIDISLSSLRPMPAFWDRGTDGDGGAKGQTGGRVLKRTASLPGGSVHRLRSESRQIRTAEPALEGVAKCSANECFKGWLLDGVQLNCTLNWLCKLGKGGGSGGYSFVEGPSGLCADRSGRQSLSDKLLIARSSESQ
jgi:hypothetical protein